MSLEFTSPDDDRGQVGIGTLIVFIAMVLVAAIAAGVLINTAGFLQSQAEETGEESTEEVSNQLQSDYIVGDASLNDNHVEEIEAQLRAGAGSSPIDLADASLLYSDGDDFVEVDVYDEVDEEFADGVEVTGGEEGAAEEETVIGNEENTATLTITLEDENGELDVGALDAGEDAEIVITTDDNAQLEEFITAPDPLTESSFTF